MEQENKTFYVGLKAFVKDGGKLLIIQRQDGQWELPGGKIQAGEDIPSALKRELSEEIGSKMNIEIGLVFHVWMRQPEDGHDSCLFRFLVGFRCLWKGGEIVLGTEHKSFRWITKEDIVTIEFINTYRDAIEYYFRKSL